MKQLTSAAVLVVSSFLAINLSANQRSGESLSANLNAHNHQSLQKQTNSNNATDSASDENQRVWLTIGTDAFQKLSATRAHGLAVSSSKKETLNANSHSRLISLPESQISALSHYMHDSFNRCGGFIFHESEQAAINYQTKVAANLNAMASNQNASIAVNYTIDNPDGVSSLLNALSSSQLNDTVQTLASYNNRYYTQQTGVDSANWIRSNWQDIAASRSDISVELFNHSWNQPSVIATIAGTTNASEIVVIGGHLDSINSSSPSSGRAPGADDNASGIAVITETLRAIVASGYKPARTIKLMGYAAEEVGLRGSKAIAQNFSGSGQNVVGVVQFDMTGNKGTPSKDIVFMTDYTNSAQNNFMMQLIDTYLSDIVYGTSRCGYACSDHASWHNEGYAASMPFESNMGDSNSRIHTTNDTAFDVNHAFKFARLSVTYLAELAKSEGDEPPPPSDNVLENGVPETGLSASQGSDLTYTMEVPAGATDISFAISGGSGDADLYVRYGAAPTDSTYDCRPYKNGNNESCTGSQSGGTYHIRIKAYSTFSGVTLVGSYTEDGGGNPNDPIDETISNISVGQGQWYYHEVDLSAGYSDLNVSISGGSGDGDLYVRQGSQPTTSSYDCRPYKWGNSETCSFNNPSATTWYIGIRGYESSSGITLSITANP